MANITIERIKYRLVYFICFLVIGCDNHIDVSEIKGGIETDSKDYEHVLGIKAKNLELEFPYKPGFVGTKFIDVQASEKKEKKDDNKDLAFTQRRVELKFDKIEYIQNYIMQKQDPNFSLIEGRDLLIRAHPYASVSNTLAPDLKVLIEGPDNIRFSVRIPATGGLPGMPENTAQSIDYARSYFNQAYLFKIPAQHVKPGQYRVMLETIPKGESALTSSRYEDSFTVSSQISPITIDLYQGKIGNIEAKLPSDEQIIRVLKKYWPLGEIKIRKILRPLMIDTLGNNDLKKLADQAEKAPEQETLKTAYFDLILELSREFNTTRMYTWATNPQVLFLPIPAGAAQSMQSVVLSDINWEHNLAQQFGHVLGLGISPECKLSREQREQSIKSSQWPLFTDITKGIQVEDEGETLTIEPMENYRWERRYWTFEWKDNDNYILNSPNNNVDLLSTCKDGKFAHPYYYLKALKNMTEKTVNEPFLYSPSANTAAFYRTNGLAWGPAIQATLEIEATKRALVRGVTKEIPNVRWKNRGGLKQLINKNDKSPHAIVFEGANNKFATESENRIIELFIANDNSDLLSGVTSFFDFPENPKTPKLFINKMFAKDIEPPYGLIENPFMGKIYQKRGGDIVIKWDTKETYSRSPGAVLAYTPFGQKAELVGLGLKKGELNLSIQDFEQKGTLYFIIGYPYGKYGQGGGIKDKDLHLLNYRLK
ncbi:MAG: hypothetical protein V4525_00575 [Pseudomonadota bacterium]